MRIGVGRVSWHCGSLYVIAGVNSRPRIKLKYRTVVPLVSRLVNLIVPACGRNRRISGDQRTLRPASLIEFVNDFANLKLIACRKRHVWPEIASGVRNRVRGVAVNPAEVNRGTGTEPPQCVSRPLVRRPVRTGDRHGCPAIIISGCCSCEKDSRIVHVPWVCSIRAAPRAERPEVPIVAQVPVTLAPKVVDDIIVNYD